MTDPNTKPTQDGSVNEAGKEFLAELLRHHEHDRPDVREFEAENFLREGPNT